MASRKAEERNEKIIRGLMKLPPNRRCINCNSLGPQYVCTNFWTFVCTTCSGIHREFTHRVKSVSMAKFTSQEVEALQNGGNQRARDIYLKDWDPQRQRLPNSSIVDKIREFIKNVYVDKKYAGGKTSDKPPRDAQGHEEETRRASSYHSYSQSPPYDNQYEDRRYGKQAHGLTRKPGSDRGLYDGKISRFAYSSSHLSEQMYEDRFANEGSVSRVSDYSTSSGGDPFRSGTESPNIQDTRFSSPPFQASRSILGEDVQHQAAYTFSEANAKRNADGIPRPQRSRSSGSFGSFDSNSMSHKSFNSGSLMDATSKHEQASATHSEKVSTLDLFEAPVLPEAVSSINMFPLQETSAPFVDPFQVSSISTVPSMNVCQPPPNNSPSSLDLFALPQSAGFLVEKSQELSVPKNDGWATFDTPQPAASISSPEIITPAQNPSNEESSFGKFDSVSSLNTNMQWPPFPNSSAHGSLTSVSDLSFEGLYSTQASTIPTNTLSWNAFEDSIGHLPLEVIRQSSQPQLPAHISSSTSDQYMGSRLPEDLDKNGIRRYDPHEFTGPSVGSHMMGPSYAPPMMPFMGEKQSHATDCKSTNPFDLPYDTEFVHNDMFLDMSSLQASLPNAQLLPTFLDDVSQPWFPQNPATSYIPHVPQGAVAYMAGKATSSQIPNVPAQGPVASIGGNPFA